MTLLKSILSMFGDRWQQLHDSLSNYRTHQAGQASLSYLLYCVLLFLFILLLTSLLFGWPVRL